MSDIKRYEVFQYYDICYDAKGTPQQKKRTELTKSEYPIKIILESDHLSDRQADKDRIAELEDGARDLFMYIYPNSHDGKLKTMEDVIELYGLLDIPQIKDSKG